jgi:hypothetical protein
MKFPEFTPEAREKLDSLPKGSLKKILSNCWCPHCKKGSKMEIESARTIQCDLLLSGICKMCGGKMNRIVETVDADPHRRPPV